MKTTTLISALLLAGAAGIAAQAYAAEDDPALLSRDACTTVRHELDALVLTRSASHGDARQLAIMRVEGDLRHYNGVLKSLACPTSRPTAL